MRYFSRRPRKTILRRWNSASLGTHDSFIISTWLQSTGKGNDMNTDDKDKAQLPLLVECSIPRTGEDVLPGHYDTEQQVWVVDRCQGSKPIVEITGDLAEMATKTFAAPERDDVESLTLLEAATKTETVPERDDVAGPSLTELLQLVTKTKAQQERDD